MRLASASCWSLSWRSRSVSPGGGRRCTKNGSPSSVLVLCTEGGLEVRIIAETGEVDVVDDERDGGDGEMGDEEKDEGVGERKPAPGSTSF